MICGVALLLASLCWASLHEGSVRRNKVASFVMEGPQGSSNVTKHNKRKSPVQRWRPASTEAVPQKGLCMHPVRILHSCCTLTKCHHYSQCIQVFNFPWNRIPKNITHFNLACPNSDLSPICYGDTYPFPTNFFQHLY